LPAPIALRLSQEVTKAVRSPESKERLDGLAMDPAGTSPAEYDAFIRRQVQQWVPFVKSASIRAD
jgi:tripartite-type tricarboxylate transporter receptor subunit TctC